MIANETAVQNDTEINKYRWPYDFLTMSKAHTAQSAIKGPEKNEKTNGLIYVQKINEKQA